MTRRQIVAVAALLLVATMLVALLGVLAARKAVLRAEGADLVTTDSVVIEATLTELRARASSFRPGTRVFKRLDGGTRAVAFLRGGWEDVPLHAGRGLSAQQGDALVGGHRATDRGRLLVDDRRYRVVGRLGVHADGPLADDAVVSDTSRFGSTTERLRLDGPSVAERYRSAFSGRSAEVVDEGTDRRTNVDVVMPILASAGAVLVLLLSLVSGSIAVRLEGRTARIRHRTGIRRERLVVGAAIRTACIGAFCAAAGHGVALLVGHGLFVTPAVDGRLGVVIGAFLLTATVGLSRASRRWS